jgi:phosphosulfolactate synthase (CoM biosynthesis protein A)
MKEEVMKEIDVEEAASWSEEEAQYNIHYLETRTRYVEAARARELRTNVEVGPDTPPEYNPEWTAKEVVAWVGDDLNKAATALEFEGQRPEPRKGLTEWLESIAVA